MYVCVDVCMYVYIYIYICLSVRLSIYLSIYLRMWGLKMIAYWPSTTEGVGTSHLRLIWMRGFDN